MSVLLPTGTATSAIQWRSEGVSAESERIRNIIKKIADDVDRCRPASYAWRDSVLDEVYAVTQSCKKRDWDGYGAEPISDATAALTAELIRLLPEGIQTPTVVPEPAGDLALEWLTKDKRHLTISITGRTVVYAALLGGTTKSYGEEPFVGEIPRNPLDILTTYFSEM